MRSTAVLSGCLLLALLGCDHTRWNLFKGNEPPAPPPGKVQTAEQLVNYLNDNAGRIQTLRTDDLSLTVSQGLGVLSVGLTGKMVVEKPRSLRLVADAFSSRMVDMGSNDQEFWFWVSKNDPPYQFFCSYKALQDGQVKQMPFPFEPEWVMGAMGLGPYGEPGRYQVESDAETVKLVEKVRSPQGKMVRKVIVFNRRPVQPPRPQMVACLLLDDATGKELVSAHILDTQLDAKSGGVIPHRLELRCPEAKTKLAMTLKNVNVNQPAPEGIFVRRPLQNVPSYDLATGLLNGQPIQRLQGSR